MSRYAEDLRAPGLPVSFAATAGKLALGARLEQDSFTIDPARTERLSGIVYAASDEIVGGKPGTRIKACVEGRFLAAGTEPAGGFKILIDAPTPYFKP